MNLSFADMNSNSGGIEDEVELMKRMQQGMMKLKTILGNYISTDG